MENHSLHSSEFFFKQYAWLQGGGDTHAAYANIADQRLQHSSSSTMAGTGVYLVWAFLNLKKIDCVACLFSYVSYVSFTYIYIHNTTCLFFKNLFRGNSRIINKSWNPDDLLTNSKLLRIDFSINYVKSPQSILLNILDKSFISHDGNITS